MNDKQIWQTIALDLKRAANYIHSGRQDRAKFYLDEARQLYADAGKNEKIKSVAEYIKFEGDPEDILLGSSVIMGRI